MKRFLTYIVSGSFCFLFPFLLMADPPDPEDVLDPVPDPGSYFFLQPYIGLGYSFMTTKPIRAVTNGEVSNTVIESGGGLGLDLGIDLGYAFNEHIATRVGLFYKRRSFSNSDTALGRCISDFVEVSEPVNMDYCVVGDYLGLQAQFDVRFNKFFGYLGFASALPLSVSYEETDRIIDTSTTCRYFEDGPDATTEVTGSVTENPGFDGLRHTLNIGAGYVHPLSKKKDLVFQLQYAHPLSNLLPANTTANLQNAAVDGSRTIPMTVNGAARFGTLSATVGIRFNFL